MSFPSIFNDVIGPVMRGPSSSHCAAALRIGRIARDLMGGDLHQVIVQYDPNGSLATTHKSQGSDMGLFGGLLGWDADDDRLPHYLKGVEEAGLDIQIRIEDIQADHPNTYKLTLFNETEMREMTAISLGGGMIEVIEIDGNPLHMMGDYNESLIYTERPEAILPILEAAANAFDEVKIHRGRLPLIQIKGQAFLPADLRTKLLQTGEVDRIKEIHPVLPVRSRQGLAVPFRTCAEMLAFNQQKNWPLWKLAQAYEMSRGDLSADEVFEQMRSIIQIMRSSIDSGIQGTTYEDRILGSQSPNFQEQMQSGNLVPGDALNQVILFVSAMMEVKSSMGVIVAAPTAGSCGALPGAVWGVAERLGLDEDEVVKAMLSAGLIGVFIAEGATFAAEVGGCMAECGSGSGMAAAAIAQMAGGDLSQALSAASQALQNSLGMICDPIANRVEAPCLGRNVMAASNALSCANMALAQYDALIPLDEVIATMDAVGNSIAHELRCTALGGLSITKTSQEIEKRLQMAEGGEEGLTTAARRFKIC